jgi:DNA-binding transcriptional MocR family regulator
MVKTVAARLGASVVPIAMDADGLLPDALAKAHRATPFSALYLQPVIHNPLGGTMSEARRQEILRAAAQLDVVIVEDMVYGFLKDAPPLAALDPERCIVVDSLSKSIAPGVAVGMLHVPAELRHRVAATVRAGTWTVSPLCLEAGVRIVADGTAAELRRLKHLDARKRQGIMAETLPRDRIEADPGSYHIWLRLSEDWRSEAFAAAAARAGVAVTPSSAFAMSPAPSPNAVRLALGLPTHEELRLAAERLARLLRTRPDEADRTE